MATVVVPFRSGGKSRLPAELRHALALAMLGDVLEAATAFAGTIRLVTDDREAALLIGTLGGDVVADPGLGQGEAVRAALAGVDGVCLVVNADLPCANPASFGRLAASGPALVAAADGTTNALSLPEPGWFAPLYGAGSALRFAAAGLAATAIPELEQDVDTLADLDRLTLPLGPRTTLVVQQRQPGLTGVR